MRRSTWMLGISAALLGLLLPTDADAFDFLRNRGGFSPPPVYAYVPQTVRVVRYQPVQQTRAITYATPVTSHAGHRHAAPVHQHAIAVHTNAASTTSVQHRPAQSRTVYQTTTKLRPVVQQVPTLVPIPMRPYAIPPKVRPGSGHPAFPYYGSTIRKMPNGIPVYYSF